ncbi:MAG: replication endonuclease, partial [Proteobacteria bacterium]|nr:replication endonuclease [Pseudomonadota bacterium]
MSLAAGVICVGPETAARLAIQCEVRQFIPSRNREDATFSARILARLPSQFIEPIKRQYRDKYQRAGGRAVANDWLISIDEMTAGVNFSLAWDDGEIVVEATRAAKRCRRIMARATRFQRNAYDAACTITRSEGVEPPKLTKGRTVEGCIARMMCPHWWRRQLRKHHGRAVEKLARELNLVTAKRQCYASQAAVERRASQKRRNRHLMENLMGWAEDENGVPVNEYGLVLADAVDASVSNPELRRGELMCRLRGFEQAAKISKHVALFITVSAPGEWHRAYSRSGQPVPHWNGSTPRAVHQYLQRIWTRTRAAWKREGINIYGFRIAEP